MSAFDTAKEVVRMASTAGLSKDVIDLMEKKLGQMGVGWFFDATSEGREYLAQAGLL